MSKDPYQPDYDPRTMPDDDLLSPRVVRFLSRTRAHARMDMLLWAAGLPDLSERQMNRIRIRFEATVDAVSPSLNERQSMLDALEQKFEERGVEFRSVGEGRVLA